MFGMARLAQEEITIDMNSWLNFQSVICLIFVYPFTVCFAALWTVFLHFHDELQFPKTHSVFPHDFGCGIRKKKPADCLLL